ncbi:MAG: cytochrome c biogenesis protein ResB [Tetrasphaera sp.]|nr:cytochrome c biogenesis protein ResB [Tetrasphaera sp.]
MPAQTITQPRLGPVGAARWAWRQVTSMRTALFLLLLLAVAALPGSIWPQRSINPARTAAYIEDHPTLGPWLDRLGFFEVYASPWFSAVYLLLFISLVGCVLPRIRVHGRMLRMPPPRVPQRLERLEHHALARTTRPAPEVLATVREALGRRYRVAIKDDSSLSAETGYLRETGNIAFHLALIGILVGVAVGHIYGWKGDVIVPVGSTFANTESRYDTIQYGPRVDPDNFAPFSLTLDKLTVTFEDQVGGRGQFGSPRDFVAEVTTRSAPGAAAQRHTLKVNHPVEMDGATVFLLGNGYAPVITVRDKDGKVLYSQATPFLSRDNNYTSSGAVKVPAARPKQLGFFGNFLPTGIISDDQGPISIFPDAKNPALALGLFEGDLAPGGRASSVYTLDTAAMTQVKAAGSDEVLRLWITPGETVQLPDGRGSITFDRVERWAGLSIRHDPAKDFTLASALLALAALIAQLTIKRRRVFVRVTPENAGSRVVVAALSKTDDEGLAGLVQRLAAVAGDRIDPDDVPAGEQAAAGGARGIRP